MGTHGDRAKELFEQGYNCAQSVMGAYAEEMGLDFDKAVQLASGFGGGMGRLRETCGTVSGMVMALSMAQGYSDPKASTEKQALYKAVQRLVHEFEAENGSIICRDLLAGKGRDTSPIPEARTEQYYKKRPCGELARYAADLLETYLDEEKAAAQA